MLLQHNRYGFFYHPHVEPNYSEFDFARSEDPEEQGHQHGGEHGHAQHEYLEAQGDHISAQMNEGMYEAQGYVSSGQTDD